MKLTDFSAVIFDMDGLVLDTEATYSFAKQQAARTLGYDLSDQFWSSLSGMHQFDIEQKLLAYCGAEFNLPEFNGASERIWRDHVNVHGIKTNDGFFELLDFIVQQALPYCLATNSKASNVDECLKLAGLRDVFPIIVTRDDVKHGKPEPDIYFKAAALLQADINRCLALEDSHAGIVAASKAGAFSVFVPSVLPMEAATLSLCDAMMCNLEQVLESLRA